MSSRFGFGFEKQDFVLDEYSFFKTNIKFHKQISKFHYFLNGVVLICCELYNIVPREQGSLAFSFTT
jgi:hypothetical protein